MMLVLDTLTPTERAVFVLREVFGFGYDEIAASVDKSEVACRQIASRATKHVQARRPRASDRPDTAVVLERFIAATTGGDLQGLMDVLAPDVVLLSDGGGIKQAALRPIIGRDKVLRWFAGTIGNTDGELSMDVVMLNGEPAIQVVIDGEPDGIAAVRIEDGLVTALYLVRNPEKLTRIADEVPLAR
jgi:RNA polymerase sigma-70 factor (ECF subfamily)